MKHNPLTRIRFLSICVFLFAAVLIGKLYYVQVVHGDEFSERADRQYVKPNQVLFDRGTIFFETKNGTTISAATVKEGFTLVMHPKQIVDPEAAYAILKPLVPEIDREQFMAKSTLKEDPYEELVKRVDRDLGIKIGEMNIPGIRVYKENWRYYPGNKLAAHTVGIVGYKEDVLAGRYGLERYYEEVLERQQSSLYINFFAEVFSNINNTFLKGKELQGDIVATIEPTVQNYLEESLDDINKDWNADSIGGIIINPKNGEIYAMAAMPTFNGNNLKDEKDPRVFSNPLVENVYEMGSIIKPISMAAGIDSGAVTRESTYKDDGFLVLNGRRISNYDGQARGVVSMQEVLSQSLNTGVAHVVTKVGNDKFADYMYKFGLAELTGIDQPNEQTGITDNLKSNRDIELATAAYGQGIAMSPIATARALSVLANGGTLITPHLVKRIDYKLGISKTIDPKEGKRVIKKETSDEITRMLVEVVDKALKHGEVRLPRYSIAAKTGTAQIADKEEGGYYLDRYLHSFFGYFPAYDPKFLVFLYQVNPKGATYASETLTYPFIDIAKFLINYYEVTPDR